MSLREMKMERAAGDATGLIFDLRQEAKAEQPNPEVLSWLLDELQYSVDKMHAHVEKHFRDPSS